MFIMKSYLSIYFKYKIKKYKIYLHMKISIEIYIYIYVCVCVCVCVCAVSLCILFRCVYMYIYISLLIYHSQLTSNRFWFPFFIAIISSDRRQNHRCSSSDRNRYNPITKCIARSFDVKTKKQIWREKSSEK